MTLSQLADRINELAESAPEILDLLDDLDAQHRELSLDDDTGADLQETVQKIRDMMRSVDGLDRYR